MSYDRFERSEFYYTFSAKKTLRFSLESDENKKQNARN